MLTHTRRNLALLKRLEVDNQVVLDGEHGVGRQPRVVFGVYLRNDGFVGVVGDLVVRATSMIMHWLGKGGRGRDGYD